MEERIRARKLNIARKKREAKQGGTDIQNLTMPCEFNSPNMSRISEFNNMQNETMDADIMDNSILKNLEDDLDDNGGMPSDGED